MTTAALSSELHERVQNELVWDPQVTSNEIGVTSHDGAVSLTGFVNSYAEKLAAERAALRVHGTRAVANDLVVKIFDLRTDTDIARDAADALRFNASVPGSVKAAVREGYVNLEGTCEYWYQRNAAEATVRHLRGVRGVNNFVTIKPRVVPQIVRTRIEDALRRSAEIDARHVQVSTSDGHIVLSGKVRSYAERMAAERAAWGAPGATVVKNNIVVEP